MRKTWARQFGKVVEPICVPYQFAFSTRAGTDCVGHVIRAYRRRSSLYSALHRRRGSNHVLLSSFLQKLHTVPSLQGLLPFVRSVYARPTTCVWEDGTGARHQIHQAEGGNKETLAQWTRGSDVVSSTQNWVTRCGVFQASRFLGLPSDHQSSSADCGTQSSGFLSAVLVADPLAVCWTPVPSFVAHSASKPVC